jgi:hypothetical protein
MDLFLDKKRRPNFLPAIVLHADILGWRDSVLNAFSTGTQLSFLRSRRRILRKAYSIVRRRAIWGDRTKKPLFAVKVFTDNLVIAMPAWTGRGGKFEPEIGMMFGICVDLQLALALEGLFLRGGLALGWHYMDRDMALGDALLEAVEMDRHGMPPRISLTPSAKRLVRLHAGFYLGGIERAPHRNHLLIDDNGTIFIDYLSEVFALIDDGVIFADALAKHRKAILRSLPPERADLYEKFSWVARYHNYTCQRSRSFMAEDQESAMSVTRKLESLKQFSIDDVAASTVMRRLDASDLEG